MEFNLLLKVLLGAVIVAIIIILATSGYTYLHAIASYA